MNRVSAVRIPAGGGRDHAVLVGNDHMGNGFDCFAHGSQSFVLWSEGVGRFKRVIGRNEEPQFIQIGVLDHPFRQSDVPEMHRIETTAVYSNFHR